MIEPSVNPLESFISGLQSVPFTAIIVVLYLYLLLFALILTGAVWKKRKENRGTLLCMIIVILLIVAALIIFIFNWKNIYQYHRSEYLYLAIFHPLLVGPVSILLEFIGMLLYGRNRKNK